MEIFETIKYKKNLNNIYDWTTKVNLRLSDLRKRRMKYKSFETFVIRNIRKSFSDFRFS